MSMPLELLNAVQTEADIMSRSFSDATQVLLRIGLSVRRDQRQMDSPSKMTAEEKRLLGE
jgi:hypothetical protein